MDEDASRREDFGYNEQGKSAPDWASTFPEEVSGPSSRGTSRQRDRASTPPRPSNAWILYRADIMRKLENNELSPHQAEVRRRLNEELDSQTQDGNSNRSGLQLGKISRLASAMWKNEEASVKEMYSQRSEEVREQHRIKYPEYKFRPRRRSAKGKEAEGSNDPTRGFGSQGRERRRPLLRSQESSDSSGVLPSIHWLSSSPQSTSEGSTSGSLVVDNVPQDFEFARTLVNMTGSGQQGRLRARSSPVHQQSLSSPFEASTDRSLNVFQPEHASQVYGSTFRYNANQPTDPRRQYAQQAQRESTQASKPSSAGNMVLPFSASTNRQVRTEMYMPSISSAPSTVSMPATQAPQNFASSASLRPGWNSAAQLIFTGLPVAGDEPQLSSFPASAANVYSNSAPASQANFARESKADIFGSNLRNESFLHWSDVDALTAPMGASSQQSQPLQNRFSDPWQSTSQTLPIIADAGRLHALSAQQPYEQNEEDFQRQHQAQLNVGGNQGVDMGTDTFNGWPTTASSVQQQPFSSPLQNSLAQFQMPFHQQALQQNVIYQESQQPQHFGELVGTDASRTHTEHQAESFQEGFPPQPYQSR